MRNEKGYLLGLGQGICLATILIVAVELVVDISGTKSTEITKMQTVSKDKFENNWSEYFEPEELSIILAAAERNNCNGDDLRILLPLKKVENGRSGLEFGVMHPKAKNTCLDTQAGWAAATIVKNRARWKAAGCPGNFIEFLGARYCPEDADELNKNWVPNMYYWYKVLGGGPDYVSTE